MNRQLWELTETHCIGQALNTLGPQRYVITSCEDGAGKTTLCQILGAYLSIYKHEKVLYVDLNRRHPFINTESQMLFAEQPESLKVRSLPEDFETLSEQEKTDTLTSILSTPDASWYTIIDTSPLDIYNRRNLHPIALKEYSDTFILVTNRETTRRKDVLTNKKLFKEHNISLSGIVVNQFEPTTLQQDPASLTRWKDHIYPLVERVQKTSVYIRIVSWMNKQRN
ncbi:MAG: hypothetical protein OCC49_19750 [Fibrobacterales bacterium]